MNDKKISDIFDMKTLEEYKEENGKEIVTIDQYDNEIVVADDAIDAKIQAAYDDFEEIRGRLKTMLDKSSEVFDTAHMIATRSQNPKDIEAFTKTLDSITKSGKTLLDMHKDTYSMKPPTIIEPEATTQTNIQNNIVFSGNSTDFIQFLKDKMSNN